MALEQGIAAHVDGAGIGRTATHAGGALMSGSPHSGIEALLGAALVNDELFDLIADGTDGTVTQSDLDAVGLTEQLACRMVAVDATFNAIKAIVPHHARLDLYQVHAVTEGTDAQAEVSVRLSENGKSVTAKGADPDTLVASAKAYLGALNKLMVKRQRGKPEAMVAP